MKKTIIGLFVLLLSISNFTYAQDETTNNNDFSKWQIRLRGIIVTPDESATLSIDGVRFDGDVDISTAFVPELDFTYFFTENWAAELILGTAKHDVKAIDLVDSPDVDLGSVWLLPPTLTGQYHFTGGNFVPYLGAGFNYTIFYGVDEGEDIDEIEYDSSFGFAFQGGFDIMLDEKWFLNVDLKKVFIKTDVLVDEVVEAEVDINPWIIGFGAGIKL